MTRSFNVRRRRLLRSAALFALGSCAAAGVPATAPATVAAAVRTAGKINVFVSWNGATHFASYELPAGSSRRHPTAVNPARRTGFGTTVGTATITKKLGKILVDSRGHALYLFTHDKRDTDRCSSSCGAVWKPLLATGRVSAKSGSGLDQKLFGTTKLSNGKRQLTYNHHPLYTFVKDKTSKTTAGEGANEFGGRWYVVNVKGNAVKPKKKPATCAPACLHY